MSVVVNAEYKTFFKEIKERIHKNENENENGDTSLLKMKMGTHPYYR